MNKFSTFDIVQTITGFAVVAGLVIVILELQQSHDIATAQQTNYVRTSYDTVTMAEIGEVLPVALARACDDPESLEGPELVALNAYFLSHLMYILYAYDEDETEITSRIGWKRYAIASFGAIHSTIPGQAWWKEQRGWSRIPDPIREVGNEELSNAPQDCFMDSWRATINEMAKDA